MSTRSSIGIRNEKGEIRSIYCHHDGYPEWVGRVLTNYYDTTESIEKLLELGDLSSLGDTLTDCFAYCRDGGEELNPARTFKTIQELEDSFDWNEYNYIFNNGNWYVFKAYESHDYEFTSEKLVKNLLKQNK